MNHDENIHIVTRVLHFLKRQRTKQLSKYINRDLKENVKEKKIGKLTFNAFSPLKH